MEAVKITLEINKKDDKAEIRFTHLGFVPEYECFTMCSNVWGSYINGSFILTGKGSPGWKELGDDEEDSLRLQALFVSNLRSWVIQRQLFLQIVQV